MELTELRGSAIDIARADIVYEVTLVQSKDGVGICTHKVKSRYGVSEPIECKPLLQDTKDTIYRLPVRVK